DGSPTVLINNLPACRMGDTILEAIGPPNKIAMGCPTVMIGQSGSGSGGSGSGGGGGGASSGSSTPTASGSQDLVALYGTFVKATIQMGTLKEAAATGAALCEA